MANSSKSSMYEALLAGSWRRQEAKLASSASSSIDVPCFSIFWNSHTKVWGVPSGTWGEHSFSVTLVLNVQVPVAIELAGNPMGLPAGVAIGGARVAVGGDRKSTRLNSSHANISYAVFCLKK